MSTNVIIDLRYFDAYYFEDPGEVPGTPPTGYALKPEVEQWIRDNGGCDGWRMVDIETSHDIFELCVEVTFSVPVRAAEFRARFPLDSFIRERAGTSSR